MNYGTIKARNTLNVIERKVLDAYFASKKTEKVESEEKTTKTYTVKSGDDLTKIAKKKGTTVEKIIELNDDITNDNKTDLKAGQKIKIETKSTKKKISFERIYSANLGDEIYVVVETHLLQDKIIGINVLQGVEKGIEEKNKAIHIQHGDKEGVYTKVKVGEYGKDDKSISNKEDFKDKAVFKIKLGYKDTKKQKIYSDALEKLTDKKTKLFLLIDAHTENDIIPIYNGRNPDKDGEPDKRTTPNYWLDMNDKWLNVGVFEKKTCSVNPKSRSHFVIHCTAGEMTKSSIMKKIEYYTKKKVKKKKRSSAHIYVMKDGSKVIIWPLTEKNVWATKIETKKSLKGQMFHIELNYGYPSVPSESQYSTLADLYIEASNIEKCWPVIVPHIEVDRGLADGHKDPTDFDYNHFYSILKNKGVPIDKISKFDHNRYWGDKSYKTPWSDDSTNWPPKLKGNPHK